MLFSHFWQKSPSLRETCNVKPEFGARPVIHAHCLKSPAHDDLNKCFSDTRSTMQQYSQPYLVILGFVAGGVKKN